MAPRRYIRSTRRVQRSANTTQPFFQPAIGEAEHANGQTGFFAPAPAAVQTKLTVGQPGDHYEQEADRVADQVVNQTAVAPAAGIQRAEKKEEEKVQRAGMKEEEKVQRAEKKEEEKVQRAEMKEEEKVQRAEMKEEEKVQRAEEKDKPALQAFAPGNASAMTVSPHVATRLNDSKGKGSTMPPATQKEMSGAMGYDFSGVRIHTDSEAESLSQNLNAHAFTLGQDIYFNKGKFSPETREGKKLLAHELVHVGQQNGGNIRRTIGDGHDLVSPRFKGNTTLEAAFDGERVIQNYTEGSYVRLLQQALVDDGFSLPKFGVDGKYGPETAAAVLAYQTKYGLSKNSKVDKQTMEHMDAHFSGTGPGPAPPAPSPVTITGGSDLWWFDGQTPAGYPVRQALTAGATGPGVFTWTILSGAAIADFSGLPVAVGPSATLVSKNRSLAQNDIVVQVQFVGATGSTGTATRRFTVLAPERLGFLRNVDKADPTFAYETEIHYNIQDQFGVVLPSTVPLNEQFTATPTADFPGMNWRRGAEGGATVSPADWFDRVQGETAGHIPEPAAPTSFFRWIPIYHWPGIWRIGSAAIGVGRRVARVVWQKYKGFARHE